MIYAIAPMQHVQSEDTSALRGYSGPGGIGRTSMGAFFGEDEPVAMTAAGSDEVKDNGLDGGEYGAVYIGEGSIDFAGEQEHYCVDR
jgi:hypothetical protein